MGLLLGIDLGTSYFKVGLFGSDGILHGLGRVAVAAESPAAGRVELPVADFWERLRTALRAALDQAGAQPEDITGISYSSQANSFVLLDGAGEALTPLVFWSDQRARPLDADLAAFGQLPDHGTTTGLSGVVPERLPVKCRWLARHHPEIWARTRRVLSISDYLTFALTEKCVGDASTAALTGLYDLGRRAWWPRALATYGIAAEQLATPLAPGAAVGFTSPASRTLFGVPAGVPFAVGALDHHAAALGSGLGRFADACLSTGTVLAALMLVEAVDPAVGRLHGPNVDGRYFRLAFDPDGAGQLEAYQRREAPELSIAELLQRAEHAGGAGASPRHGREVRALLERIAHAQDGLLDRVAGGKRIRRVMATGGGARSPFWLQLTANVTGREILAVDSPERACLGAALFAAVAAGTWPSVEVAALHMVKTPRSYLPVGGSRA
jgi:sugar (pentulose or hexulose) kinase